MKEEKVIIHFEDKTFADNEAAYLAGVAAAKTTKTKQTSC